MRTQTIFTPVAQAFQKISFLVTAVSCTNALPQYCDAVELLCTQDCHFEFLTGSATEGTAIAASSAFLKAGLLYRYACPKGSTDLKISAIRDTADGTLYINPLTQ